MSENSRFQRETDFVSRHYREGAFRPTLRFGTSLRGFMTPKRWAAAILIAVTLTAGAMICYRILRTEPAPQPVPVERPVPAPAPVAEPEPVPEPEKPEPVPEAEPEVVSRIEFDDTPVSVVARKVEEVYGVRLGNLPADDPAVTISYEGNAADLVETLNELLGSEIVIK